MPIDCVDSLIPMGHSQEELIIDERLWNDPHHLIDDERTFISYMNFFCFTWGFIKAIIDESDVRNIENRLDRHIELHS